jgi:hypothetical protein
MDDVISLNNSRFGDFVYRIYPIELEIKDTTDTDTTVRSGLFKCSHFPFICSNIPAAPGYGVHISQFI